MAASEKEIECDVSPIVSTIEFDGIGLAIIGFKDADINVNNEEVDEEAGVDY